MVTNSNNIEPSSDTKTEIHNKQTTDAQAGQETTTPISTTDGPEFEEESDPALGLQQEPLTNRLDQIKDILDGKSPWGKFLEDNVEFEDALTAIRIVYKYHPTNDGTVYDLVMMEDTAQMKEDLRHLSAIGVRLAALGAFYESSVEAIDQERRLARSRAWARIRRARKKANPKERITNDMLDNEANASVANFYHLQSDVTMAGKILSWVRVSIREFNHSLRIMITTQISEDRRDAFLNS